MSQQTSDVNIVILPPNTVQEKLSRISKKLAQDHVTLFSLGTENCAHITLYQARFPTKNLPKVERHLSNIAKGTEPFQLTLKGYSFFNRYLFLDAFIDAPLVRLQNEIISNLNDLREGALTEFFRTELERDTLKEEYLRNIKQYGYLFCGQEFTPHISLSAFVEEPKQDAILKELPDTEITFNTTKLALGPIGDHATFNEPTSTFKLSVINKS